MQNKSCWNSNCQQRKQAQEKVGHSVRDRRNFVYIFRLNIPCRDVDCSVAVPPALFSGTARLQRRENFRELLRVQLPSKIRPRETCTLSPYPGLQPVCRITQEQVRSHVLCESPPAKREASHRLTIRLLLFVLTIEIASYSQDPGGFAGEESLWNRGKPVGARHAKTECLAARV